ncbi:MAG: Mur ligase domain-containing protein, partial [Spirochaetota bacterium]
MKLSDIAGHFPERAVSRSGDAEITSLEYDSRRVVPGSLFVAVRGLASDGHDYIGRAVESGAAAVGEVAAGAGAVGPQRNAVAEGRVDRGVAVA